VATALARAVGARAAARLACWTRSIGGASTASCTSDADPGVARADRSLSTAVCAACGGADRRCGGAADDNPVTAGFSAECPAVTAPGGASCAGPVASPADLAACFSCAAGRVVDCVTDAALPARVAYPTSCDPPRPACAAGVPCATALDCPAGYACLDNGAAGTTRYCVGPACTDDAQCGGGGVCRQQCTRDGFTVTCGARHCQCPGFGCTGAAQLCIDSGSLACRKICLQDSDCVAPFGFVCVNPGFGFGLCIGTEPCE